MANSARLTVCGKRLELILDPLAGSWVSPATLDTAKLADIAITATRGAVTATEVRIPKKYPWVDLATNQVKVRLRLSRRVLFDETVTVDIPASLISDGVTTNATSTGLSVTNGSFNVPGTNPRILLDGTARICYVDPSTGNDTNAAAANGGLGYYTTTDVGDDPRDPDVAVVPYATFKAALDKARNSTSGGNVSAHGCVLVKRGETIDGATDFKGKGGVYQSTGGISHAQPFVVGSYGLTGDKPILQAQQTVSGGAKSAWSITGPNQYIVFLDLKFVQGVNESDATQPATQFASSSSVTRNDYLCKNCEWVGGHYWNASNAGFRQLNTGFDGCWFDGNNASGSGGIWSSDENWADFMYRDIEVLDCAWSNASSGGLYHGLYVKNMGDLDVEAPYFYDCGGTCCKLDGVWGADVTDGIFIKVNSLGNTESNGSSDANLPTDRTKDAQTTEYPVAASSEGAFAKWQSFRRNIISDTLVDGERGSNSNNLIGFIGPSHDCGAWDNLGIFDADSQITGFRQADDGGSGNGYVKDCWDFEARNNTVAVIGTSTRSCTGFSINPADDDSFSPTGTDQVGIHGLDCRNNIFYFGSGRTSSNTLFQFGTEASDQDYAASYASGRSEMDVDYNDFFDANGYTDRFRNGGSADLFASIAAMESDFNSGGDTGMTGNRAEDPGFTDPTYKVSTYFTAQGYTITEAMTAIRAGLLEGSIPAALTTDAIAATVLPKWVPESLSESNYNNAAIGATSWTASEPTPLPPPPEDFPARGIRNTRWRLRI
jgi:hypothetical protein